jgi:hypothetical protein
LKFASARTLLSVARPSLSRVGNAFSQLRGEPAGNHSPIYVPRTGIAIVRY